MRAPWKSHLYNDVKKASQCFPPGVPFHLEILLSNRYAKSLKRVMSILPSFTKIVEIDYFFHIRRPEFI